MVFCCTPGAVGTGVAISAASDCCPVVVGVATLTVGFICCCEVPVVGTAVGRVVGTICETVPDFAVGFGVGGMGVLVAVGAVFAAAVVG